MTHEDSDVRSRVGGGLGAMLGGRIVQSLTDGRMRAAPINKRVAEAAFAGITNHVSDEVRSMVGHLFGSVADHPDTPDEMRPLFRNLARTRGQAMAWIGGAATGAAMAGGLGDVLTNALRVGTLPIIRHNPTAPLSAADAASAAVRGLTGDDYAQRDAASNGVNADRYEILKRLATVRPTIDQLHVMLNRGMTQEADVALEIRKQGYDTKWLDELVRLRAADISPEVAAQMWNRDIVSTEEGRQITRRWGLTNQDFDRMALLGGEPPAVQELLLAWRRGVINEADVDRALIQGPVRKEWVSVIKQLQWEPLSPTEAADSVNQGHLDKGTAQREASFSGVKPEHFDLMIENAGLPPGLEVAAEAFNRGLITDAEWERMFLESRLKNPYIPLLRKLRINLLPTETIRLMFREGIYSEAEAINGFLDHGYSPRDARAQVDLEKARRSGSTKDLTSSQIVDLFEEGIITEDVAGELLADQGFDLQETRWRLAIGKVNQMRRYISAALTRVRNAYVGGHIDEGEARERFRILDLTPEYQDRILNLWDLEADTVTASLTSAQIISAAKKDIISWEDAFQRHIKRGYDPVDAAIIIRIAGGSIGTQEGATE